MKIKVFYENGTTEILDSVKNLGIVGSDVSSKDLKIIHHVAVRFCDNDVSILRDVRRIEEA